MSDQTAQIETYLAAFAKANPGIEPPAVTYTDGWYHFDWPEFKHKTRFPEVKSLTDELKKRT